jgi:hypothetical protein
LKADEDNIIDEYIKIKMQGVRELEIDDKAWRAIREAENKEKWEEYSKRFTKDFILESV